MQCPVLQKDADSYIRGMDWAKQITRAGKG